MRLITDKTIIKLRTNSPVFGFVLWFGNKLSILKFFEFISIFFI